MTELKNLQGRFEILLREMITRVDNGYNALVGNNSMAKEYAIYLMLELKKEK